MHKLLTLTVGLGLSLLSSGVPVLSQAGASPNASPASLRPSSPYTLARQPISTSLTLAQVKAAIPQLESLTRNTLEKTKIPGLAMAIVYQDQIVYLKGFGVREVGRPELVNSDTVFQIASLSKPVTATVISALVSDGRVQWDDPVQRYLPEFSLSDPAVSRAVTIRDLLAHRSGLPDHGGDLLEDIGFDRAEVLRRLRFIPIANRFRAQYDYTNFGFTTAALAAAKSTGQAWEDIAESRLFQPLGMTNSSYRYADFLAQTNRVKNHQWVNGEWQVREQRNPDAQAPAGGVSASIRDLAQWMRLQLNNGQFQGQEIIRTEAFVEPHRPQMISSFAQNPSQDRSGFYGLGWGVSYAEASPIRLSHSGAFALGAATVVNLIPAEGLGIIVLSNAAPIGVPEALAASFLDLVSNGQVQRDYVELFQGLFAKLMAPNYGTSVNYAQLPANGVPAQPFQRYVGRYENDYFGPIAVEEVAGQLVLFVGPNQEAFPLQHYNGDVFSYQPRGENAFGRSGVTFTMPLNSEKPAQQVMIEYLNTTQLGTFSRTR